MIKISTIFKIIVSVCTMMMLGTLLLFPIEIIGIYEQRVIVALIAVALLIAMLFIKRTSDLNKELKLLIKYVIPYTLVILLVIGYSKHLYDYSLEELLKLISPYFYVFMAFPLVYIFHCDRSCFRFLKFIAIVELLMLFFRTRSWYLYNFKGIISSERLIFQYDKWVRDGYQRIEAGMLYGLVLVILMIYAFKKNEYRYRIAVVFMILYLIFVTRVRFQTATALVTVFVMYYFMESSKSAKMMRNIFIVITAITILLSGLADKLIDLVSVNGRYGLQTLVRLQGIEHYFRLLREKNAILGLGILNNGNAQAHHMMIRDEWSIYYLDDIGIFGGIAQFGILTLIIYGWLFILAIQVCIKCYKDKNNIYFLMAIGITSYMIISCILLNFFDIQRAYDVPFYLAVLSYIYANTQNQPILKGSKWKIRQH